MPNYWEVDGETYSDGPSDEGRGVRHLANRGFNRWMVPMCAALGVKAVQTVQAAEAAALDSAAAAVSAGDASDSALSAQTAQAAAETARNTAQAWAETAEDVPVSPGVFSARHWAAKALAYAQAALATIGGIKITITDTTPLPLSDKLGIGTSLTTSIVNPGGVEQLVINARLASVPEALAGVDDEALMTPAKTAPVAAAAAAAVLAQMQIVNLTADAALVAGRTYRLRGGVALTLTLPADPADGDTITLICVTAGHVLDRNGATIMSLDEDMTLDLLGRDVDVWFDGVTWRLF